MGIREKLNQNPGVVVGAAIVLVVVAVFLVIRQFRPAKAEQITREVYFTSDDGQTFFKDDIANDSPFKKDGKEAVTAYVYRCPGGKPFVGYLERFSPEALQTFAEARQAKAHFSRSIESIGRENLWVKRPGDKNWTKMSDDAKERTRVLLITCPDGSTRPERVY